MSARASSTARSSLGSRRPADRPRRWGSTTVVCSTRTQVARSSRVILGRKLVGRALAEVGATSVALRSRNSSACTMTAKRAPRCSCPRVPRSGGRRKTSPRTISRRRRRHQGGHLLSDDAHLLAIVLVGRHAPHLIADRGTNASACRGLAQRLAHRFGIRHGVGADHVEGSGRGVIETNVKRSRHSRERSTNHATRGGAPTVSGPASRQGLAAVTNPGRPPARVHLWPTEARQAQALETAGRLLE